jgi:hypothetical protein
MNQALYAHMNNKRKMKKKLSGNGQQEDKNSRQKAYHMQRQEV